MPTPTILHRGLTIAALAVLLGVVPTYGADTNGDNAETILFPFAFLDTDQEVPGAHGTVWSGEAWYENRNDEAVRVWAECYHHTCFGSSLVKGLGRQVFTPAPPDRRIDPLVGFRFLINLDEARNITFSSRIFERTLRAQPRGVDIPLVREGEFFAGPEIFLGVPAGAGVRTSLRIYDPWAGLDMRPHPTLEKVIAEVRAFSESGDMLGEIELRPTLVGATGGVDDWNRTGFAVIYDLAMMVPGILSQERIHISVRPVPDGAQYWGMVAVTDNETQTVSIITAQ